MIKIAIQGINGRMGQVLVEMISQHDDCRVVAGIDMNSSDSEPPVYSDIALLEGAADVLIDFSLPDATDKALDYCAQKGLPCVICTTGLSATTLDKLKTAAEKTAVFHSANMSLGINLLSRLVRQAQALLKGFDIEIVEKHHRNKLDAPSGTALMLADAVNEQAGGRYEYIYERESLRQKRSDNELGISAVRGGSIVGEHDVIFAGPDEVVTLSHTAYSRNVFASGAVAAAVFLADKGPGLYSMQDLMEAL